MWMRYYRNVLTEFKTFDVDLNTTSKLAPLIPYEAVLVSGKVEQG